jgi:hypothetical protein
MSLRTPIVRECSCGGLYRNSLSRGGDSKVALLSGRILESAHHSELSVVTQALVIAFALMLRKRFPIHFCAELRSTNDLTTILFG